MRKVIKNTAKGMLLLVAILLVFAVIPETDSRYIEQTPYETQEQSNEVETEEFDDPSDEPNEVEEEVVEESTSTTDEEPLERDDESDLDEYPSEDSNSDGGIDSAPDSEEETDPLDVCAIIVDMLVGCENEEDCDFDWEELGFDMDEVHECFSVLPFTTWTGAATWSQLRSQVNTTGRTVINLTNSGVLEIPAGTGTGASGGDRITIPAGRNVTIRGAAGPNGDQPVTIMAGNATLANSNWMRRHFYVASGATLTLENIILDGGVDTLNTSTTFYRGGISASANSHIILGEGAVIRRTQAPTGGAIHIWGASTGANAGRGVVMHEGSTIQNSFARFVGGGIHISDPGRVLTINGGIIENNSAEHGGGINIRDSAVAHMNGGRISGNELRAPVVAGRGAGVWLGYHATFNLNDGEISDNHARGVNSAGAGVFIGFPTGAHANSATFNMRGGAIDGNTSTYGAGLDVGVNGRANLYEGAISNNTARRDGGGMLIYIQTTNAQNPPSMSVAIHDGMEIVDNAAGFDVTSAGVRVPTATSVDGTRRGYGGGIHLSDSGILHLHGGEISRNEATGNGGGINIFELASSAIPGIINLIGDDDLRIEDNIAANGGGINWTNGQMNTVGNSGSVFMTDNHAHEDGGGLRIMNGNFIIDDDWEIIGNTAGNNGGGLNIQNGSFTMNGGLFEDNTAVNGGGVYITGAGTVFNMSDGIIRENTAVTGGGVSTVDAYVKQSGGRIHDNNATGNGGGLHVTGTFEFIMIGGTIDNNGALNGGGVRIAGDADSSFTIRRPLAGEPGFGNEAHKLPVIEENRAINGGGVDIIAGTFNMEAGYIRNHTENNATPRGRISLGGGVRIVSPGSVESLLNMTGGVIEGNTTSGAGGGVYAQDTSTIINISAGTIRHNTTSNNGGGIYFIRGPIGTIGTPGGNNNLVQIYGNEANGSGAAGNGAAFVVQASVVTMYSGTVRNNEANNRGGGVRVAHGMGAYNAGFRYSTFVMNGGIIHTNEAGIEGGGISVSLTPGAEISEGGVIFIQNGGYIENNTSRGDGGGVDVRGPAHFIMNGGTVGNADEMYGNNARLNGGGVFVSEGVFDFNAGNIIGNTAGGNGGGVWIGDGSTFTMNGVGSFFDRLANDGEGAITANTNGARILNNTAINSGGGVWNNNSTFTFNNGLIYDNTARHAEAAPGNSGGGGGIHLTGANGILTMNGGAIVGNTATGWGGGGVRVHHIGGDPTFNMHNGDIHGNHATHPTMGYGGGIMFAGGDNANIANFTMGPDALISGNYGTDGGGVYISTNVTLNLPQGTITNNTAVRGGGVYLWSQGAVLNLSGGNVTDNQAVTQLPGREIATTALAGSGGGIFNRNVVNFTSGVIEDNVSATNGGGIYLVQTSYLTATGGSIIHNRAPNGDGGGIFTERHWYHPNLRATDYNNVNLTTAVTFDGNRAISYCAVGPRNPEIIAGHIPVATDRSHGHAHVLSNDDVNYHCAEFEFIKTTEDRTTPLEDAVFHLYERNAADDGWNPEPIAVVTSLDDGWVRFNGLSFNGQYRLREESAPDGFRTPTGYWIITIVNGVASSPERSTTGHGPEFDSNSDGDFFLINLSDIPITGLTNNNTFYLVIGLVGALITLMISKLKQWDKNRQYEYIN